ncbi:stage II sporulation protein D [Desulfosporosinus orientis DSM 765]|uniref:Stage II sporulation protein D n=1 Tax=Desulfosporosinus orientis (strain ATCC 19365 / DSM 765 / NCIMB 8382 / VKM B-1628 / Singapore I) TaxID=768706 RepID=G7WHG8_DESOD|nr:stage II sporulation protein D [Desulfosporosinus orientis]AET70889.1 stage II sporulation protein D [Desulfosporosinus orientis DSM 765]
MKKEWIWLIVISLCVVIVIPFSILRWHKENKTVSDISIKVLMPNGNVEKLSLEEYVVGVVAAEMPAEFELEALKAQAVAARTYAVKRIKQESQENKGYDVDTTVQTQVWLSDAKMRKNWGWLNYWQYRNKINKAVAQTQGVVLVYNGDFIDAFFHSSCGRRPTERSEDVWSSSRPYLQNVSSGEVNVQRYVNTYRFTAQELFMKLGLKENPRSLNSKDFQVLAKTAAGRAKSIQVLGKVYTAVQVRTALGLASTDIEYTLRPEGITITTYGNGHAVGMSQWGANDLAKSKRKVGEILAHYYPGSKLANLGAM